MTNHTAAPAICPRCGKRHPEPWLHAGDCTRCQTRPVSRRRHSRFCDICVSEMQAPSAVREADADAWLKKMGWA